MVLFVVVVVAIAIVIFRVGLGGLGVVIGLVDTALKMVRSMPVV